MLILPRGNCYNNYILECHIITEFEMHLHDPLINEPDLPLPHNKEGLFVIRPIE